MVIRSVGWTVVKIKRLISNRKQISGIKTENVSGDFRTEIMTVV